MTFDFDLVPDLHEPAIRTDDEGRTINAHIFAAIQLLQDPGSIGLDHLAGLVGSQDDW